MVTVRPSSVQRWSGYFTRPKNTLRVQMWSRRTRVLTNDPGTGVLRHADAGYEIAERAARDVGIRIPMLDGTHAPPWQPPS